MPVSKDGATGYLAFANISGFLWEGLLVFVWFFYLILRTGGGISGQDARPAEEDVGLMMGCTPLWRAFVFPGHSQPFVVA